MRSAGMRVHVEGRVADARELVVRLVVDPFGDVRNIRVGDRHPARPVGAGPVVAVAHPQDSGRVVQGEGLQVGGPRGQTLEERRIIEVAQEPRGAAGPGRRRGAGDEEAQLTPPHLARVRTANGGNERVAAQPPSPVVAVLEALAGIGMRRVLGESEMVVRVDQPGRDDHARAHDLGGSRCLRRAIAAHAGDLPCRVDEHLSALDQPRRREHIAVDQLGGVARVHHTCGTARERARRSADDLRAPGAGRPAVHSDTERANNEDPATRR